MFVCSPFFGHFETDLDALWHNVGFAPGKVLKQQYLGKLANKLESVRKKNKMHFSIWLLF